MAALVVAVTTMAFAVSTVAQGVDRSGAIVAAGACTQNALPRNDDSFSGVIDLPFAANFYGQTYDRLWVNNNGNVTFDGPLSTYTAFNLTSTSHAIIAPFFADVDTRGGASDVVRYGWGETVFEGRRAFCVNWLDVGYYSGGTDKLNSFQLLLVDRSDVGEGDFDIVFNYGGVEWEAGSASGGSGGLGGSSARAGFANGDRDPENTFELPGSGVNGRFLDSHPEGLIHGSLGTTQRGRYVWKVRNGRPSANTPPDADAGADVTVPEGDVAQLDAGASSDPDGDELQFRWTRLRGTGPAAALSTTSAARPSIQTLDDATADFRVTVDDGRETAADEVSVEVANVAPQVSAADATGSQGGATVLAATFSDPGLLDRHEATIDWGDGSAAEPATVVGGSGWGSLVASHRYSTAGSFEATVTVADDDGGEDRATAAVTIAEPGGLWAGNRTASPGIHWAGSENRVLGGMHANGEIKLTGSRNQVNGTTEYGTRLRVSGSENRLEPAPVKVPPGAPPHRFELADYAPGGRAAREVGAGHYFDKTDECRREGEWKVSQSRTSLATGVYYVPCGVEISGSGVHGEVTIASTGGVKLSGSGADLRSHVDGLLFLTTKAGDDALHISGSSLRLTGYSFAEAGEIQLSGSDINYACALLADRLKLDGSRNVIRALDCSRPASTVALSSLVPSPELGIEVDRDVVHPGDELTYRATVTNAGATLVASGLVGAQNLGDENARIASYHYALEYLSAATGRWETLAGTAATADGYTPREPAPASDGVRIDVHAMASPGATYQPGQIVGAVLEPGALGAWGYQARLELTPEQVRLLADPARVEAVRNVVHLEDAGGGHLRELYRHGNDFAGRLRADSGDLEDAAVTIAPPVGDPVGFDSTEEPALGRIAPGASASVALGWDVPAPAGRDEAESSEHYLTRLQRADGVALRGAARVRAGSGSIRLAVPQKHVSTTRRLPVVALDKGGPESLRSGVAGTYDLRLENLGTAEALQLAVDDRVVSGGSGVVPVTGVPAALAPGATATPRATHVAPSSGVASVGDRGAVRWQDANGNEYGPVEDEHVTRVVTPPALEVTKTDFLDVDADGDGAVSPGDVVEYDVRVENTSTGPVDRVLLSDTVDANTALVPGSVLPSQGEMTSEAPLEVAFGTLAGRRSAAVRFKVRIADALPRGVRSIANQGTVTSAQLPPIVSDDPATPAAEDRTVTSVRARSARLAATKQDSLADDADGDGNASPGDTLRYEIEVVNEGDAPATGLVLTDRLGEHTALVPGSVTTTAGTVTSGSGAELRVDADSLEPGAVARVAFEARVDDPLPIGADRVTNQAQVDSHQTEPQVTDDPATAAAGDATVTALALQPRLVAEQTDSLLEDRDGNGAVSPGDRLRYRVRVQNVSGGAASGVTLNMRVGAGMTLVDGSVTTTQGTTSTGAGTVDAALGDLAPGAEATVTYDVDLEALPPGVHAVSSQGSVGSDQLPTVPTDDPSASGGGDATVTEVVNTSGAPPALTVRKRDALAVDADGNGRPSPGDTLSYEVDVWNAGAGAATGVVLSDRPDPNAPLVPGSVQVSGGGTVEAGNAAGDRELRVRLGTVPAASGQTLTFQVVVAGVMPSGVAEVRNQAEITSAELGTIRSYDPDASTPGGVTLTRLALPPATPPAIGAVAPADGATVTEPVPVRAQLTPPAGQSIESWCVRVRSAGDDGTGRELRCGTGAPGDALATFDPTVLVNGSYVLTVEATASGGGVQRESTTLLVDGDLKPGRFTTTYRDLAIPMHGLPIQVLRSYDSFDKSAGDFGVGWNVDVANVRVQVNRSLGEGGWSHQPSGCTTLLGQSICLSRAFRDLSSHFVTVTWPDGRTEVFDFTPTAGSGGIYYDASARFTARRGTTSRLEPVGDPTLQYWGDGNLYESDGLTIYDPKQFALVAQDGTRYLLDVDRGLVRADDRHGNWLAVTAAGVESSTGRSVTFTRDPAGRITQLAGPSGERLTYAYDAAGNLEKVTDSSNKSVTFEYDADHNLELIRDPEGAPLKRIDYDADGRITAVTDAAGETVQLDVDLGARRQVVTDPSGELTTILVQDDEGNLVGLTDVADGATRTWAFEYDANGNRTRTVDPRQQVTTATYDAGGNVTSSTDATDRTWRYEYDGDGRLERVLEPGGSPALTLEYDEFGDVVETRQAGGPAKTFSYDSSGRLATTEDATGRETSIGYDAHGNIDEIIDPASGRTAFTWDASNRLTSVTDARGATTRFEWDTDGNMTKRTGPMPGDVRTYGFDALSRLISETDPRGKQREYRWDAAGRLESSTDRNGVTTAYEYDADGRLVRRDVPGDADTTFGYTGFGELERAENSDARVAFAYDGAGRLERTTTTGTVPETTIAYAYDAAGRRTRSTAPWGSTTSAYDAAGALETITDPSGGVFRWSRDAAGRPAELTRPNGVVTSTAFDAAGRVSDVTHALGSTVLDEAHLTFNAAGAPDALTDRAGRHEYSYDAAGQLLSATHPAGQPSEAYAYDLAGRRTSDGEVYDAASRLLSDDRATYTYDDEGNVLTKTDRASGAVTRYAWDAEGRLQRVTTPAGETTYRYDPLGRRIAVNGPDGARRFAFGDDANPLAEYGPAGDVVAVHTFGPGLDMPLSSRRGGSSLYPLQDPLANVTAVTGGDGAAAERYRYGAFGQRVDVPEVTGNEFTFAGREWDPAAGAYHLRARSYDPATGRFLSQDPLPGSLPYGYALNNPVAHTDATGLMANLSEANATAALQADLQAASTNAYATGHLYQFMRTVKTGQEIGQRLYTGMSEAIASRLAAHRAAGYVASDIEPLMVQVTSRIQLQALEQTRLLAARLRGADVANKINAMSRHNWEKAGQELVERWLSRNPSGPQSMLDDIAEVFGSRGGLPFL